MFKRTCIHFPQITLEQHATLRCSGSGFSAEYWGVADRIVAQVQQDSMVKVERPLSGFTSKMMDR
jgi:hypothetical protein